MWHLIPAILYVTYTQAYQSSLNSPYGVPINEQLRIAPSYLSYSGPVGVQTPYNAPRQNADYPSLAQASYSFGPPRAYVDDPYLPRSGPSGYYKRSSDLRQAQSQQRTNLYQFPEVIPFDLDYGGPNGGPDVNFPDPDQLDLKSPSEIPSYFEDLELTENFGNYLKRRTQLDASSTSLNDAAHQYNALLAVIIALARVVRNSCAEFDLIYDQYYLPTVETYYRYGLANADKIGGMIEEYIRKGNSNMPKLRKLKEEICEKDLFCSVTVDNKIKSSPLLYVKELETLEAIAHLARSYYPYIEEFNQAAQKGNVLSYLQKSKDRLREYVMHVVNSVEHLTDKAVNCM